MAIISFTNYKRGQTTGCMGAVMRYTMQNKKTEFDGQRLVTGINCQPESVYADFMTTKRLHHKTDGVLFYHMVQSFPKSETVDPVTAHAAALKLAEYYEGYEVLVCTHTDREHIHSHFLINSVNFDTGKKLHIAKEQLQELRQRNDQVCMEYPSLFNFIICFAAALVWGNNYYWMKVANCRSEKVARKSFVSAAFILLIVFMIPLCLIGGYMGTFHSDALTLNGGTVPPTGTYGFIATTFIPLFGSLVVISAVAASISTASTSALGASAVANRDIYQRIINPNADAKKSLAMSKVIMLLVGIVTFVFCQFPGGPTYLFAFANCWLVPPAVLLGLGAIWPRFNSKGALGGALCGMITMAVFTVLQLLGIFDVGRYVYLATLGLVVTFVAAVLFSLMGTPKYYGQKGWERVPTASNRTTVSLGQLELRILEMLRVGHCYMADLTDALGVDSKTSGQAVENLDQGGYLVRAGLRGSKFYTFSITEKGLSALPALSSQEANMAKDGLTPMYLQLLQIVQNSPEKQAEFVQKNHIKSMHMAAISSHLTRRGYLVEKGIFKRKLAITAKGAAVLKKYA